MVRIRTILLTLLSISMLGAVLGAGQAFASQGQVTYFEASTQLLNRATRPHAIAQMQHLGVKAVRIELRWADVVPSRGSAARPAGYEATNPARYEWGEYDALMAEAQRLHWKVLLTVTAPVPRWATSNGKAPYVTRPDDKDFEEFMTAVGTHYGSEVSLFSIWNEPNEPVFLLPQWNSNGTPASPRIYRGLYQAGYAGLKAAKVANLRVLFGETAPAGYDTVNIRKEGSRALRHPVAPLAFLRLALCLNAKYKKSGSCGELQMSGYAHHAYTLPAGPYYVWPQRDNVTIGSLSRLSNALDLAARAHAIPGGVPIYLTEFGVQSTPNRYLGVSPAKQAEYDALDEHIAYSNPRVAGFSQYLLKDDPVGGAEPEASFQTGLEYVNGSAKPLYDAWPIPLTVTKLHHGVALWGLVRPATGATKVTVLVRVRGAKRYRTLRTVATNGLGYWSLDSTTAGESWRVRWKSPTGATYEGPPMYANAPGKPS